MSYGANIADAWRQAGAYAGSILKGAKPADLPVVQSNPVKLGLTANLARPDGNLTGVNFFSGELAPKRLELLHELVPGASHR